MISYPLSGFGSRPVGDPPLDPPDDGPEPDESFWACTTCGAPIYRRSDSAVGHVRGALGIVALTDKCSGATATGPSTRPSIGG